jgi:hypothetical protein
MSIYIAEAGGETVGLGRSYTSAVLMAFSRGFFEITIRLIGG